MINRSSPIPLYFQLAEVIRGQINSGQYRPGDKLPTENELCEEYDVSRSVVRQGLLALSQDGLIETERGRGAFVRERKVPIALQQRLDPLQESMAKAGFTLTTRVLRRELVVAPGYIAEQIGDRKAILIERLRYADGQVLLLVRNYVPYGLMPELLDFEGLDKISLYEYMREKHGIIPSTGRRIVEIGRVDEAVARHLGLERGSNVLFNREVTFDQEGRAVEYYESWHHPDRTRLNIELHRNHA